MFIPSLPCRTPARIALTLAVFLAAAGHSGAQTFGLTPAFDDLRFEKPVGIYSAHDGTGTLYVLEQRGRILSVSPTAPFDTACVLDISAMVTSGGELGLLGLAFDPDFRHNGTFFVDYTRTIRLEDQDRIQIVVARYHLDRAPAAPQITDSGRIVLVIDKPHANHNGGQLAFGPGDYLYISTGDGSQANDDHGFAQNRTSLLGKILRIDVRWNPTGTLYGIPAGNPYADDTNGYRKEIYAYGLRNPWRFSFDPVTWRLWAGDVGQETWEEVNIIEPGGNYGWSRMEGRHCFPATSTDCDTAGITLPIWEYPHVGDGGVSVVGGFVYRGTQFPALYGRYVYGDFGNGRIWALSYDPRSDLAVNHLLFESGLLTSSFGVDDNGELFVCTYNGRIYRLMLTTDGRAGVHGSPAAAVAATKAAITCAASDGRLALDYTTIGAGRVSISLYDLAGRETMRLVDEAQPAGDHRLALALGDLPDGLYLCRLSADGRAATCPVMLAR